MQSKHRSIEIELASTEPLAIRLRGEIDAANARGAERAIRRLLGDACDLTVVTREIAYVDSSGLGLLVALHRECCRRGGRLTLVEPSPGLNRVLQITGLARLLAAPPKRRLAAASA